MRKDDYINLIVRIIEDYLGIAPSWYEHLYISFGSDTPGIDLYYGRQFGGAVKFEDGKAHWQVASIGKDHVSLIYFADERDIETCVPLSEFCLDDLNEIAQLAEWAKDEYVYVN